ncbi:type VII secretion system-associated protein [Actinophytocola oryzae]|uniref:Type III secretion system (T3SS) SseB-like protein n=1 Tax=Actinophytocola oryzae TaxID=502181 RepID=A0A4R7V109_9PSEU|nr:type VII secretion system-associated protein [Actinophytocola oryzae]TDV42177.1 hypothetical protein CLV71_11847 [Actinophytocola oryzae]
MTEPEAPAEPDGRFIFLVDPAWRPTEESTTTPMTSIIGAWPLSDDGVRGRFQPNPVYFPSTPDSPLDPVDAVLGKLAAGEFDADLLPEVLTDVMFGIALDERGVAIVRHAPDGVPSVLVTTSYGHRERVDAADWRNVTLTELAEALPARGVDVLLNPGASTSMRVLADAVRAAVREHAETSG